MLSLLRTYIGFACAAGCALVNAASDSIPPFPADPDQLLERTCFQTSRAYGEKANLRSDVAIVYGVDPALPDRVHTWRDRGYRIHVMTGVSWGHYQDYLYGRFDGTRHEDEAQTDREGQKISHGGDVYYMCPGENFGKFLSVGVQRALDAGAEAVHLEEPEFWVRGGYSEGFKREWRSFYGEDWQAPHTSVDAQWRASKLKYFLYRRALQQVFDHVQNSNQRTGRRVRCYVPTHSLLNYAHWRIVSPESSLAQLRGCDGYIAQVWTGTSRTPNCFAGVLRERTFETAFLEYGAMQNLVRATGRTVWYLNDPVEDDPNHDWEDYRANWESTLVASLLQPEVWRYEVMPWPERVFAGRYPKKGRPQEREPMPEAYATELQTVLQALNQMNQPSCRWESGTPRLGIMVSDSLMFQRGDPNPSDPHLSHIYGLALPLLKRGMPITPVQLENSSLPGYLDRFDLILMTYHGMKPLSPEVHPPLARWVRSGGVLIFWDDDTDPYREVREWWNQPDPAQPAPASAPQTPRERLFQTLGLDPSTPPGTYRLGHGRLRFVAENPARLAADPSGSERLVRVTRRAALDSRVRWSETDHLLLHRGPFVVAAGLDESVAAPPRILRGRFVSLFDPNLLVLHELHLAPASRQLLLDLDAAETRRKTASRVSLLASACKALPAPAEHTLSAWTVEGVAGTQAVALLSCPVPPRAVRLDGQTVPNTRFDPAEGLLWIRFPNEARPRRLEVELGR